jgi:hypothetical protein
MKFVLYLFVALNGSTPQVVKVETFDAMQACERTIDQADAFRRKLELTTGVVIFPVCLEDVE